MAADVHLTGPRAAPRVEGWVELEDGHLEFATLGVAYRDVRAVIVREGTRLGMTELHVHFGSGTLQGSGWIDLGPPNEYAITRRFSIRGSASTGGNTAVDLFWSRRY